MNKPSVSRGRQIVLIYHQDWICPCAYVHCHKIWDQPTGFTEGMIIGEGDNNTKTIFTKQPAIAWDNYFSGGIIFDYAGSKRFGLLMTVWQGRLPSGVQLQYLHKKPTEPGNSAAKYACYTEPIVMVTNKEDPETNKKYQKVHECTYKPFDRLYAGDENMRVCVQQHRSRHEKRGKPKKDNTRNDITVEKLKRSGHTKYQPGRLCGDLERFCKHVTSKYNAKKAKPCEKEGKKGQDCFLDYHNDYFFGLARKDTKLVEKTSDWKAATTNVKKHSKRQIKLLCDEDSD
eukprot:5924851-Ditylum_brightwellii.AAC.1